jgi:hypothetical protein
MEGLKSLYRAYNSAQDIVAAKYSLFLEGAIASGDPLNNLLPDNDSRGDDLRKQVGRGLKISDQQCNAFLDLTTVQPNQPPREHIKNSNVRLLAVTNPNTSQDELEAIEATVTDEIFKAMSMEQLGTIIPSYIKKPDGIEEQIKLKVEAKRMTAEKLRLLFGSIIAGPFPLLRRLVDPNLPQPTNLERKLIDGGATAGIVKNAKELRANATIRALEFEASALFDGGERLDDVHFRIETLANSVSAKFDGVSNPARQIWAELLRSLSERAKEVDPNMIYRRDPYLLMGAACGLSDECHTDWG